MALFHCGKSEISNYGSATQSEQIEWTGSATTKTGLTHTFSSSEYGKYIVTGFIQAQQSSSASIAVMMTCGSTGTSADSPIVRNSSGNTVLGASMCAIWDIDASHNIIALHGYCGASSGTKYVYGGALNWIKVSD